ncbi:hypothetical protein [Streptomyces orinoci]|uniref:DUF3558 domain-containing protein n=1 Tax=Streptomyces orinoci TaxID=67339 RepID=A0ABV3K3N8_STRON|nr:hypothetical protein [Streptomyces orinoci]
MHRRTAPRLARILACAAVPVMLVAGCSSGGGGEKKSSATPSATSAPTTGAATPTVAAVKYPKTPDACKTLSGKTIDDMVPKAKKKEGDALPDGCFWNGLNDEDPNDLQYRALTVSLKNVGSDPNLGSGDKRAQEYADSQVPKISTEDGAKNAKTEKVSGIGDWATSISTVTKKDGDEFQNETVVARTANVVVTVKYSGTGYQGAKAPDAGDLMKSAKDAAKEAVAAVAAANKK